jgi:amino acid transporter
LRDTVQGRAAAPRPRGQQQRREASSQTLLLISRSPSSSCSPPPTPQYGGPVAIIWGWVLVTVMNLFVGLALSEMASAFPTAGGVFYWSGRMGGKRWG